MQYYNKLKVKMSYMDGNEFCFWLLEKRIITKSDMEFIQSCSYKRIPMAHKPEVILSRMASRLLSGETNIFYKLLEIFVLRNCADVTLLSLLAEVHVVLKQAMSSGMYISAYILFV